MIKLNDENIYVGQIKQLLSEFNLPRCRVCSVEDAKENEIHISGDSLYIGKKRLNAYKFGDKIENVTDNLMIDNMIYDEATHVYLGDYLRFLRDFTGLDLMQLYNCFSYYVPNIVEYDYVVGDETLFSISSFDKRYNVFSMPIKFGQRYSIFMDWHGDIQTMVGFHSFGSVVTPIDGTVKRFAGPTFDSAIVIDAPERTDDNWRRESELRLFIKVAKACTSEIVAIEGDYELPSMIIDGYTRRLGDAFFEYEVWNPEKREFDKYGNYDYVTKSQLLEENSHNKTLLADRLVEYLSNQAITQNDPIIKNVKRLQKTLIARGLYVVDDKMRFGIWDDHIREAIYRRLWETNRINEQYDMLSYCDKDAEMALGGLDNITNTAGKIIYE